MSAKNNRLIAEFMGNVPYLNNAGVYEFMVFKNSPINSPDIEVIWKYLNFKYDTDWNWLMEVVKKIEDLGYIVSTNLNSTDIKNLDTLETITYNRGSWKQYKPPLTKIESVYNACVEFIKWYNLKLK
jgi:hypothetical protein